MFRYVNVYTFFTIFSQLKSLKVAPKPVGSSGEKKVSIPNTSNMLKNGWIRLAMKHIAGVFSMVADIES